MVKSNFNFPCPSCAGRLEPRLLGCSRCEIEISGRFEANEFATLSADDLHLLRIFVRSEGKVREMEAALGLSYPTIRTRLTALRLTLGLGDPAPPVEHPTDPSGASPQGSAVNSPTPSTTLTPPTLSEALERLERGEGDFETALRAAQSETQTRAQRSPGRPSAPKSRR